MRRMALALIIAALAAACGAQATGGGAGFCDRARAIAARWEETGAGTGSRLSDAFLNAATGADPSNLDATIERLKDAMHEALDETREHGREMIRDLRSLRAVAPAELHDELDVLIEGAEQAVANMDRLEPRIDAVSLATLDALAEEGNRLFAPLATERYGQAALTLAEYLATHCDVEFGFGARIDLSGPTPPVGAS